MTKTIATPEALKELAEKLSTIDGGRVWIAEKASDPHVRVYFGEHFVAVYDRGESYDWKFEAAPGTAHMKSRRLAAAYNAKVETVL